MGLKVKLGQVSLDLEIKFGNEVGFRFKVQVWGWIYSWVGFVVRLVPGLGLGLVRLGLVD